MVIAVRMMALTFIFLLLPCRCAETWLHDKILPLSSSHNATEREVRNFPMTLCHELQTQYTSSTPTKRCFMSVRSRHSHRELYSFFFFLSFMLNFFRSYFSIKLSFTNSRLKGDEILSERKNLISERNPRKKNTFPIYMSFWLSAIHSNPFCLFHTFLYDSFFVSLRAFYYEMEILRRKLMWYIAIHVSLNVGWNKFVSNLHIEIFPVLLLTFVKFEAM